jgi:peptide/nickel transport system substrate-binding protein
MQRRNLATTQRLSRRRVLGSAGAAGLAALVAACSGQKKPSSGGVTGHAGNAPKGGTLTKTIVGTDAKSFHPYQTTDSPSSDYQGYVYGGGSLTKYDPKTLVLTQQAAARWSISDDKKTYTFILKDMQWSDGAPVTTDDYLWTYQQARKPENHYPYAANLDTIASYVAQDPKTLVVTMTDALVVGLENADAIVPLPKHVWERYDWNDPVKNPEIDRPTVVNGMWKLRDWQRDDHATFVANNLYYDGPPNINTFTVRVFGTPELAYQALASGQVNYSGFDPSEYKNATSLSNVTVYHWYPAAGTWAYVGFNLRRPALQDPNLRKAIAYATDRKSIIDTAVFGLGKPIYANYPQESPVYNPNVEHYDFNLDKARALLKQAGYNLNSSKKLMKDGKPLSLKLLYPTSSTPRKDVATILQQQLGQLGMSISIQGLEFQAYVSALQTPPFDWDMQLGEWEATIDPYWQYQIWSEDGIPQLNAGAYINKQVEQLYQQGAREFDSAKSKQIYWQIQKILADDAPYVFLYEALNYDGLSKKVGGLTATPLGIEYNMNKWYIAK